MSIFSQIKTEATKESEAVQMMSDFLKAHKDLKEHEAMALFADEILQITVPKEVRTVPDVYTAMAKCVFQLSHENGEKKPTEKQKEKKKAKTEKVDISDYMQKLKAICSNKPLQEPKRENKTPTSIHEVISLAQAEESVLREKSSHYPVLHYLARGYYIEASLELENRSIEDIARDLGINATKPGSSSKFAVPRKLFGLVVNEKMSRLRYMRPTKEVAVKMLSRKRIRAYLEANPEEKAWWAEEEVPMVSVEQEKWVDLNWLLLKK